MKRDYVNRASFLVVALVILCPTLFVVKPTQGSSANAYYDVTSQACGINGHSSTTVRLTARNYQDLQQYLADFRTKLNQTKTTVEAAQVFDEAVIKFNQFGLLPQGMSVTEAQHIVHRREFNNLLQNSQRKTTSGGLVNILCLITGQSTHTFFIEPIPIPLVRIDSLIIYGSEFITTDGYFNTYADGWLQSYGLLGIQSWSGKFQGAHHPGFCCGGYGFTGLVIGIPSDKFYIGGMALLSIDCIETQHN